MVQHNYRVPALKRMARILQYVGEHEPHFPELVKNLGLPKSSTYGLLKTLEELGFLRRLSDSQRYSPGFKLFELGNLAVSKINIRIE